MRDDEAMRESWRCGESVSAVPLSDIISLAREASDIYVHHGCDMGKDIHIHISGRLCNIGNIFPNWGRVDVYTFLLIMMGCRGYSTFEHIGMDGCLNILLDA